jgi:hypothetical protein
MSRFARRRVYGPHLENRARHTPNSLLRAVVVGDIGSLIDYVSFACISCHETAEHFSHIAGASVAKESAGPLPDRRH